VTKKDAANNMPSPKKPYHKPTVTKLTPEQAKLKLRGLTPMDPEAKELLEVMSNDDSSEETGAKHSKDDAKAS
jgi:cell division protein FtsN